MTGPEAPEEHRSAVRGERNIRSEVFPGLRLAVDALLIGDVARVLAVLQDGIGTVEHAEFVKRSRTGP